MRIKICGITKPKQGKAITELGATALGFMCVPSSPRYISTEIIYTIIEQLPSHIDKIGVFANTNIEKILETVKKTGLTGIQLHGDESIEYCQQLRESLPQLELPQLEIIKALRIRGLEDLQSAINYTSVVNTLLLDAYHPQQLGGTGKTIDWTMLEKFQPNCPWFLAGGLTPDNILQALSQVKPSGIDLSSGVELSPGDKDLEKVAKLFEKLGSGD